MGGGVVGGGGFRKSAIGRGGFGRSAVDYFVKGFARIGAVLVLAGLLGGLGRGGVAGGQSPAPPPTYRLYVANESSDLVSRVAFTPGAGAIVEREIAVGIMPGDIDGAHGITVSPDGRHWYVTIAHGTPKGSVWKFAAGPDTLVARAQLGLFPATMGVTPDGQLLMAVNFNLHGDMIPSDVSVVYTPEMIQVARIRTCLMPHGSRVSANGRKHYSACMHSERLVEIDMEAFAVSAAFELTPGHEGPAAVDADAAGHGAPGRVCSPTWVEPGAGERADRFVFVACNRNQEVLEIDTRAWSVVRRFATGAGPYNLEATADGRLLIATLKGEQAVAVFDLESGAEVARIATSRPVTHGVVASPDGRYAFVSNESVGSVRGTLDVIDLETLTVVATVELEHQSGGIDFWEVGG